MNEAPLQKNRCRESPLENQLSAEGQISARLLCSELSKIVCLWAAVRDVEYSPSSNSFEYLQTKFVLRQLNYYFNNHQNASSGQEFGRGTSYVIFCDEVLDLLRCSQNRSDQIALSCPLCQTTPQESRERFPHRLTKDEESKGASLQKLCQTTYSLRNGKGKKYFDSAHVQCRHRILLCC